MGDLKISAGEILIHIMGGVCLLLWGVSMISRGLNKAFGTALRRIISKSTSNRLKAFSVGAAVAAVLQSSTATCMIVSSFAARNIITVAAAVAVMLGADMGTTLAAQIMSLDLNWLIPVLIALGYIVSKSINATLYKHIGQALIGVGLALLSLKLITNVAEPLKHSEALQVLIQPLTEQPFLAVLFSALLTWIVHSSLGMVLLYMGFAASGTIPVDLGLYMVLGANIGGAIGPVVMTMRDIPAGRRVPLGNLIIRGIGVILILPFMSVVVLPFIESIQSEPARMIVNFHTAFNLGLGILFLPFIGHMTSLSEIIFPDRPRGEDKSLPRYLDPNAISTPAAALACAARETLRVCDIVQTMFRDTLKALHGNNYKAINEIREKEVIVDNLYESIKIYLSRVAGQKLDEKDARKYMQILTFSTNLEHIGDIIDKSLMELVRKKIRNQDSFSRQGFAEISSLHSKVMASIQLAQNLFMTNNVKMAKKLSESKSILREDEMSGLESHLKRLSDGVAETLATSSLHLDILRDLRRINSYISLIAYPIIKKDKEDNAGKNIEKEKTLSENLKRKTKPSKSNPKSKPTRSKNNKKNK